MRAYNFLVCGPKFTDFFRPIEDKMLLIKYLSDFRYVDPFRRHLQSNSKVVTNSDEFWTFFTLPNFVGGTFAKLVTMFHPGYELHPLVKSREVMPPTPKIIGAHMWNFKLNFKCSPLKFFGEPPTRFVVCASKPWPVSSACKNLRGRNIVFRKKSSWVGQHARL